MNISSYPKVYALGHRFIADILNGDFHLEEKIDGSQISFGYIGGYLRIRSKGQEIYLDAPEKMFAEGVGAICNTKLVGGFVYRGEYLKSPKHNTLKYDRIPKNHIMIFDIEDSNGNPLEYSRKVFEAESAGFECAPRLNIPFGKIEDLESAMSIQSCLGGCSIEGIVVKNYNAVTDDGKFMAGKYVSEAFKECHTGEWKKSNPSRGDILQSIIDSLKTDARYNKALQHLKEDGLFTGTPQDIPLFLKELHKDIDDEEYEYIMGSLMKYAMPKIKRGVCAGAPEWLKKNIANNLFIGGGKC